MDLQASKQLQKDLLSVKELVKAMSTEKERLRIAGDNPHTFLFNSKFMFISHSEDEVCLIFYADLVISFPYRRVLSPGVILSKRTEGAVLGGLGGKRN